MKLPDGYKIVHNYENKYYTITNGKDNYIYDKQKNAYYETVYPNTIFNGKDYYITYEGNVIMNDDLIYQEKNTGIPIEIMVKNNYLIINGNYNTLAIERNTSATTYSDEKIEKILSVSPRLLVRTKKGDVYLFEKEWIY